MRLLLFELEVSRALSSDCFFTLFFHSPAQHRCGTAIHCLSMLSVKEKVTISRRITAPGHGKSQLVFVAAVNFVLVPSLSHIQLPRVISGVVDAINGVTKSKLTSATARNLLQPDEGMDVKKLNGSAIREGKKVSIAGEMAWWLVLEGSEGAAEHSQRTCRGRSRRITSH